MDEAHEVGRKQRRTFTDEFKQDAVRLVTDEKYTFKAAAEALGIGEQSLRQWHAKFAPKPAPCGDDASLGELREENKRLRRELRRAELEREILKKATAYFAKESL
jgi:transposase